MSPTTRASRHTATDAGGAIRHPYPDPPSAGTAVELAEGALWMRLSMPMRLDHVNVYAFDEGDGWAIVDTGLDTRRTRTEWEALLSGPLRGRPVRRVLVTHHHPDHIGLAGWFQAAGAELLTTRTAWLYARMLTLDVQERPTPEALAFWTAAGMHPDVFEKRAQERPYNFADIVAPLPLGFVRLLEGQGLRLGGRDWTLRTGGGHAPEHATLWENNGPLVIGGDQLLPGISPNIGVYPTEPDADPLADWLESCRRFIPVARDDHLVLPGHKTPFTGLPHRLHQMIDNHESALDRLRAHLVTPRRASACFVPIFKREIDGDAYGLALVETLAHLNYLWRRGEVTRHKEAGGAWLWQMANAPTAEVRSPAD